MGDTATLLRLIAASAIVGLLVYCGLHVLQVWRKRNARPAGAGSPRPGRKLAWVCLLCGLVLTPAALFLREMTRTEGMLTGEGLYVVRAMDDMAVEWLPESDTVVAGQPLARFGSGPRAARADEQRARLARAEAEANVLALLPLSPDPELTRRHQAVSQERVQAQQELGQAVAAYEVAGRDLTAQLQTKTEALARLERTLTERRKALDRANIRAAHARELLNMYADLRVRGTVSAAEYQEQQKELRDATVEAAALTQELKDGQAEKELLRANLDKLETRQADPDNPLRLQVASLQKRVARLEADEADLKAQLNQDLARSARLREAEKVQATAKVTEQRAALAGLTGEQQVVAPFAGRIAYRAQSPNAVRSRGPLLVLGPDNGFLLTARLPRAEAEFLRDGGEVMIEVGEDVPERRIPARFREVSSLAHDPEFAALHLECQPPPEIVRRLADGEKLAVGFTWHPPLAGMWAFRAGVLLFGVGLLGLLLTRPKYENDNRGLLVRLAGPRAEPATQVVASWLLEAGRTGRSAEPVGAGVDTRPQAIEDFTDLPTSAEELEDSCRNTLEQLNRAEDPEEATRLLERLHRMRRALRALDAPINRLAGHANGTHRPVAGAGS